jgi:hypothetical protein
MAYPGGVGSLLALLLLGLIMIGGVQGVFFWQKQLQANSILK